MVASHFNSGTALGVIMAGEMKSNIKWLLLPAACLSAGAAHAQALPSVFGVQLEAPVTLPECQPLDDTPPPPNEIRDYRTVQPVTCAGRPYQLTNSPFRRGDIWFPHDQKPELCSEDLINAFFSKDGNKVLAVEASTPAFDHADWIIAQLTAKFGKPTSVVELEQMDDGILVPTKHVVWKRTGFTVDYRSVAIGGHNEGDLLVSTDEYDRLEREYATTQSAKRTPL
jgi:hypothetical protein